MCVVLNLRMKRLAEQLFLCMLSFRVCACSRVRVCFPAAAAAQALHMANQAPQQQMYSPLAPSNPAMNQGPNPQSPQATFPTGQQTLYLHPQQVPHGYNPNHMAHVQQVRLSLHHPGLPVLTKSQLFVISGLQTNFMSWLHWCS